SNPSRALARREYVLRRMKSLGFITDGEFEKAHQEPVTAQVRLRAAQTIDAEYVAEMVREDMFNHFGEGAYTNGYSVVTTIDSVKQDMANRALRRDLLEYEQRHGYRGREGHIDVGEKPDTATLD